MKICPFDFPNCGGSKPYIGLFGAYTSLVLSRLKLGELILEELMRGLKDLIRKASSNLTYGLIDFHIGMINGQQITAI